MTWAPINLVLVSLGRSWGSGGSSWFPNGLRWYGFVDHAGDLLFLMLTLLSIIYISSLHPPTRSKKVLVPVSKSNMKEILLVSFVFLVSALGISAQISPSELVAELPRCAVSLRRPWALQTNPSS